MKIGIEILFLFTNSSLGQPAGPNTMMYISMTAAFMGQGAQIMSGNEDKLMRFELFSTFTTAWLSTAIFVYFLSGFTRFSFRGSSPPFNFNFRVLLLTYNGFIIFNYTKVF